MPEMFMFFETKSMPTVGVVSGVELVLDEPGYYRAFSHSLISYKYELELKHVFLAGGKTYLFVFLLH
jgi:hypothetical protein